MIFIAVIALQNSLVLLYFNVYCFMRLTCLDEAGKYYFHQMLEINQAINGLNVRHLA